MKTDRLLYLSAYRMTAYRWHSGVLESEGGFAANEEGHQQFSDYIKQHRQATFTLLANVSDEGFHVETIPFLQGKDRKTVIERKLGQQFFSAPLTASLSLGYEKSKRKDERILLAALTNGDLFTPWISAITRPSAMPKTVPKSQHRMVTPKPRSSEGPYCSKIAKSITRPSCVQGNAPAPQGRG